jgi:hypothetical protein
MPTILAARNVVRVMVDFSMAPSLTVSTVTGRLPGLSGLHRLYSAHHTIGTLDEPPEVTTYSYQESCQHVFCIYYADLVDNFLFNVPRILWGGGEYVENILLRCRLFH